MMCVQYYKRRVEQKEMGDAAQWEIFLKRTTAEISLLPSFRQRRYIRTAMVEPRREFDAGAGL